MSELKEIRSSSSHGGGCFSWVLGRRNKNKPEAPVFVKSLSKKEIMDKHTKGKWQPSKEEMTLVEDLSQDESYHSYVSEKEEVVEESFEGFGSDEDEDNIKNRRSKKGRGIVESAALKNRLSAELGAHKNSDRVEMLAIDDDGSETASPSVLTHLERDSEVRFGLSGGKVRKPSDAVTPKRNGGAKGAVRRARKLEYGDEENNNVENLYNSHVFDALEEEVLPGGVHSALSPASKGRRRKQQEDKKAWGQAVRSDWVSGMR